MCVNSRVERRAEKKYKNDLISVIKQGNTDTMWEKYRNHESQVAFDRHRMTRNDYIRTKGEEQVMCERT